ncbi:uncharacterized protein LOC144633220 [Oculina patagonica]
MLGFHKKLWSGMLLLFFLSGPLELHGESETGGETEGHSLTCYWCHSTTSWEDCDKKMNPMNCTTGYDEVCQKRKIIMWVDIKNSSQQEKQVQYSRGCDLAKTCSGRECKEKDWDCTVDCCYTDLCNISTPVNMLTSFTLTAVLPWLALEACFAF